MKRSSTSCATSTQEPERMAVGPERAADLRESARQGGEAEANIGLVLLLFLLAYAVWVLMGGAV